MARGGLWYVQTFFVVLNTRAAQSCVRHFRLPQIRFTFIMDITIIHISRYLGCYNQHVLKQAEKQYVWFIRLYCGMQAQFIHLETHLPVNLPQDVSIRDETSLMFKNYTYFHLLSDCGDTHWNSSFNGQVLPVCISKSVSYLLSVDGQHCNLLLAFF